MEVIPLQTHYGPLFRILHSCSAQAITRALEEMDLTAAQGRIMGYLAHSKQAPCARDIEEVFQLTHPTVSGLLSRLEKKGFIEFRPDEKDRRCKRIYMLPKGIECNETIYQIIQQTERQVVEDFTQEEQTQFADFLKRAISNMGFTPTHFHSKEDTSE